MTRPDSNQRTRACTAENMHPYECDGPQNCVHCDRDWTTEHDPATCPLCDPEYDHQPNTHWGAPR